METRHRQRRDLGEAILLPRLREAEQRKLRGHGVELHGLLKSARCARDHEPRAAAERFPHDAVARPAGEPFRRRPRRAHDELSVHHGGVSEANPIRPARAGGDRRRRWVGRKDELPVPFSLWLAIEHDQRLDRDRILEPEVLAQERHDRVVGGERLHRDERLARTVGDREVVHRHADEQVAREPADGRVAVNASVEPAHGVTPHALASPIGAREHEHGDHDDENQTRDHRSADEDPAPPVERLVVSRDDHDVRPTGWRRRG